ncbi:disulfide oxidoreductase [Geomicrobium sp. JCM 19055]|uniref:disulfide oxidoreductase n=1 Tax=Geomicrobium sp. JCM 19055 TaxID=1460649 RepID=UPI00045EDB16|nr:disulfide oxidoreductase [Geomicrobium sp. JCM 19055]GAJ97685.1 disulfide bond formation protein, BdbC-like [Geomicrobium sp. JCM 19055]
MKKISSSSLLIYIAWIVSVVAMLGSLYFSEIKGFVPCDMCWYQRIVMYPFVILLGVASFKEDQKIYVYTLPLSILGTCLSFYHYLMQKVPNFAPVTPCSEGVPCSMQYINWFGFITIPFLAFVAFLIITILMVMLLKNSR